MMSKRRYFILGAITINTVIVGITTHSPWLVGFGGAVGVLWLSLYLEFGSQ